MAEATTLRFSKFRVLLGDGASPEAFTAPCGFNARALNRSKNLNDNAVPDCLDDDAAPWLQRDVASKTWSVTGEGVLTMESRDEWEAFFASDTSRSVQVIEEWPDGDHIYEGRAHIATLNKGVNRGERATINVDLQGDGALVPVIQT